MIERFRNRKEAGRWLAKTINHLGCHADLVLALPRGGVPVGAEVAKALDIPLQVFVVRKLGVPGHEEYAMGAIASGGVTFLNDNVVRKLRIPQSEVQRIIRLEQEELKRREESYNCGKNPLDLSGRSVVLVDDGLATGATMKVAARAIRQQGAGKIIVAVPVAPASARDEFETLADKYVAVLEPELFYAVGQWYEDFSQTTDDEVRDLLSSRTPVSSIGGFHGSS